MVLASTTVLFWYCIVLFDIFINRGFVVDAVCLCSLAKSKTTVLVFILTALRTAITV
jgi:hypothetical protein